MALRTPDSVSVAPSAAKESNSTSTPGIRGWMQAIRSNIRAVAQWWNGNEGTRPRVRRRIYGPVEQLESRLLMSGTPLDLSAPEYESAVAAEVRYINANGEYIAHQSVMKDAIFADHADAAVDPDVPLEHRVWNAKSTYDIRPESGDTTPSNTLGLEEKWLSSNQGSLVILPNGQLYTVNGGRIGEMAAALSPAEYDDPGRITSAQQPITVSFELDPDAMDAIFRDAAFLDSVLQHQSIREEILDESAMVRLGVEEVVWRDAHTYSFPLQEVTSVESETVVAESDAGDPLPSVEPEPNVLYDSDTREAFWQDLPAGQEPDLNARVQLLSTADVTPSADAPVSVETSFTMSQKNGGIMVITRTDGAYAGRFNNEYAKGLVFTVEYNGISVWHYGSWGARQVIGYTGLPQNMILGKAYDLLIEDTGTEAHVLLKDGGTVLADLHGAINGDPEAGKLAVRKQDVDATRVLTLGNLQLTHGMTVPAQDVPDEPDPAPEEPLDPVLTADGVDGENDASSEDAWHARQMDRLREIARLQEELHAARSPMAALLEQKAGLETEMADLEERAAKIGRHLSGNLEMLTPTLEARVNTGDVSMMVRGGDLPEAVTIVIGSTEYSIPEGTETVYLPIPYTGTQQNLAVRFLGANGSELTEGFSFLAIKGKAKSGGSLDRGIDALSSVDPAEYDGGPFTAEELADVRACIADCTAEYAAVSARLQECLDTCASVETSISALRRELVPYARMNVDGTSDPGNPAAVYTVRFASPHTGSEIRVLSGDTLLSRAAFDHANGEEEAVWTYRNAERFQERTLTFELWSTGENARLLQRVNMYQSDIVPSSITPQTPWGEMEAGRLEEHPMAETFSVARISGPSVLLHITSPRSGSYISIGNDSLVGEQRLEHTEGTSFHTAIVTINTARPTGDYTIDLYAGDETTILQSIPYHWDAATQTITVDPQYVLGSSPAVASGESVDTGGSLSGALGAAMRTEINAMMAEDQNALMLEKMAMLTTLDYTETHLDEVAGRDFYNASPFVISYEQQQAALHRHPNWGLSDAVNGDLDAELRRLVDAYADAVGELLLQGVNIYVTARQGGDVQAVMDLLNGSLQQKQSLRYLQELAVDFGFSLPGTDQILAAAKPLYDARIDQLINYQDEAVYLRERGYDYAFINGSEDPSITEARERGLQLGQKTAQIIAAARAEHESAERQQAAVRLARIERRVETVLASSSDPRIVAMREAGVSATTIATATVQHIADAGGDLESGTGFDQPDVLGEAIIRTVAELTTAVPLEIREGLRIGSEYIDLQVESVHKMTFTLDREVMANFWMDGLLDRNIDLTISGGDLPGNGYASDNQLGAGESVSLKLTAGTYTLTVIDRTPYEALLAEKTPMENLELRMEVQPWQTSAITGRISIDGRDEVMPVSLRVAEFDPNTGDRLQSLKSLDPSKPVWVVIHGMNSSESDGIMKELTKALYEYREATGIQVVTVDWSEAARDGVFIQDAPWTVAMGQWVARRLLETGIAPENINGAGWSHGTYGLYEMGREIERLSGSQMNALVALDAARNIPLFSGYDHTPINFSAVSRNSLAIDSSIIAGDETLAATADVALQVRSNELNPFVTHKLAVTTFTSILNHERANPGSFSQYFSLQTLMGAPQAHTALYTHDAYDSAYEGIIDVQLDEQDTETYFTTPVQMKLKKPFADVEDILHFDSSIA